MNALDNLTDSDFWREGWVGQLEFRTVFVSLQKNMHRCKIIVTAPGQESEIQQCLSQHKALQGETNMGNLDCNASRKQKYFDLCSVAKALGCIEEAYFLVSDVETLFSSKDTIFAAV